MATTSSNARNINLFNTFRSCSQFVGFLINDLISCGEEIPDYVYIASNELLTKVLCLTNSIYKISETPKILSKKKLDDPCILGADSRNRPVEYTSQDVRSRSTSQLPSVSSGSSNETPAKNKSDDPYRLGVDSRNGLVEYKSQPVTSRSTPQLSSVSNGSNNETSSFISFVKAATRNATYPNSEDELSFNAPKTKIQVEERMIPISNVGEKIQKEKVTVANTPNNMPTENEGAQKKMESNLLIRKTFALTKNFCTFLCKLVASSETVFYCQLCDCLVVSLKKWSKHIKVEKHVAALPLHHPCVLFKCSHCPFCAFVDVEAASKYFDLHVKEIHPHDKVLPDILDNEKYLNDMISPVNALPDSGQPTVSVESNTKATKSRKKAEKASDIAVMNGPSGSTRGSVVSTQLSEQEYGGDYYESAFCYILRMMKEYFEERKLKVNAGFCIPCQAALDSMDLWSEHIKMPEHMAACTGFFCKESTCPNCNLTVLGPEEAITEYMNYSLHLELDPLFT